MKRNTQKPLWKQLLIDVIIAVNILFVFAYFHHVNPPGKVQGVEIIDVTPQSDVIFNYTQSISEDGKKAFLQIDAEASSQILSAELKIEFNESLLVFDSYETGDALAAGNAEVQQNGNVISIVCSAESESGSVFRSKAETAESEKNYAVMILFDMAAKQELAEGDIVLTANGTMSADNTPAVCEIRKNESSISDETAESAEDKFADKFTDGEVIETETTYMNANVNVSYETVTVQLEKGEAVCHVVDIYTRSYEYFRTSLLHDEIAGGLNHSAHTTSMAKKKNAIAAINGDYCSGRNIGPVVKNGVLYRTEPFEDIMVMYTDGSMKTYEKGTYADLDYKKGDIWQVWSFGPSLLSEDGGVKTKFNSVLTDAHPRSAIGYYEPGHYCLVAIDGRNEGGSDGMTLTEMSEFFHDLGCTAAYNLDGGRTSVAAWNGEVINNPVKGGRPCSDIVYIPRD